MRLKKRFEQLEVKGEDVSPPQKTSLIDRLKLKRKLELSDEVHKDNLRAEMQRMSDDLEKQIDIAEKRRATREKEAAQKKLHEANKRVIEQKELDLNIRVSMSRNRIERSKTRIYIVGTVFLIWFIIFLFIGKVALALFPFAIMVLQAAFILFNHEDTRRF